MNSYQFAAKQFCAMIHIIRGGINTVAVHCTLSTLMGKRRYSIQDVHNFTGLSRSTISSLYNDKATRIDFYTMEKLCFLFECTASDLFEVHYDLPFNNVETK